MRDVVKIKYLLFFHFNSLHVRLSVLSLDGNNVIFIFLLLQIHDQNCDIQDIKVEVVDIPDVKLEDNEEELIRTSPTTPTTHSKSVTMPLVNVELPKYPLPLITNVFGSLPGSYLKSKIILTSLKCSRNSFSHSYFQFYRKPPIH